jgi:hypothetical protein
MNRQVFYEIVKPYTMTSKERVYALFDSLEEIRKAEFKRNKDENSAENNLGE